MPYQFLENIAIADIAFKAWGKGPGELFMACADAIINVMVEDLKTIAFLEERWIEVENDTIEMLLFGFLQEIIFYKDAETLLLRVEEIDINKTDRGYHLKAKAKGEEIDPVKHSLNVDVKAVTLHRFNVQEKSSGWEATVVLDI